MQGEFNQPQRSATVKPIILVGATLLVVLYFHELMAALYKLYAIIFPIILGVAIAYIVNILVSGYEKIYFPNSKNIYINNSRRSVSILLSVFTIFLAALFFLWIVIPQVGETIRILAAGFPGFYNNAVEWAKEHADQIPGMEQKLQDFNMDGEAVLKRGLSLLGNWAFGTVSLIGAFFGKMVSFIVALVFSIYTLFGKEELKGNMSRILAAYMRPASRERFYSDLKVADETFSSYIVGQFKEAVILGILCTIGMWIFGFPYAATIGPVIGLTALIPMIGAYLGAAVGFFLIVMIDPLKAGLFIIFIVILQQLEGNLIYPKVVGESIGLPGIWVLAAITVGGGLMGIAGILLGVPIAATLYKLLARDVEERLERDSDRQSAKLRL